MQYTVILHANNGTSDKITSTEWSTYTLPAELPDGWTVREGYYFAGWSETPDGPAVYRPGNRLSENRAYTLLLYGK